MFRRRREQIVLHGSKGYLSIFYHKGQYCREEITEADVESKTQYYQTKINWIESNLKILPAETHIAVPDDLDAINRKLGGTFLDPLYAASHSNLMLLSDDRYFREIADEHFTIDSVWIQPLLKYMVDHGMIGYKKYYESIATLIDMKHDFTSVEHGLFVYLKNNDMLKFERVSKALFGKGAEFFSHYDVLRSSLMQFWRGNIDLKTYQATGILLRRIFFHSEWRQHSEILPQHTLLIKLKRDLQSRQFNQFLEDWLAGHFVSR